jgi:NADH-quinone oxidoreductase subunit N
MTVGNLVALRQRQAVRLLAWSSIAQSGYMLVPLGAAGKGDIAGAAGDRGLRPRLRGHEPRRVRRRHPRRGGTARPTGSLTTGRLGRTEPDSRSRWRSRCLPGRLPPGLLGLFAKVVVFQAPVSQGTGWLAVVMAVNVVWGSLLLPGWAALALRSERW